MKDYVDYVLRKAKKPVELDKIYTMVELLRQQEDDTYELTSMDKDVIDGILSLGLDKFDYYKTPAGRYTPLYKTSFRKGRFHGNKIGEGFVIARTVRYDKEGNRTVRDEKFSINKDNCNHAVDGDFVLVDIGGNGKRPSVAKIINRNLGNVIGAVTKIGNGYYVVPVDKKKRQLTIALNGDYVEGEIVSVSLEEKDDNYYVGNVVSVFEHRVGPYSDALLEAFKCGMPQGFSEESIKQLEDIPEVVREEDRVHRCDFTDWDIISIDGASTKDKDDCVCVKKLVNGNYLLSVHISDVPYYVPTGSPLDIDAFRKGTSYYYAGLVEPMHPKKISNGICSLNDGVERLTKSVLMEIDSNGTVVKKTILPGIINSRAGLNYDQVNDLLDNGINNGIDSKLVPELSIMKDLATILKTRRISRNAILFNKPEVGFDHDENGKPTAVKLRCGGTSQTIVEEFMLVANASVLELLTENEIPCVYRVHDEPSKEKLEEFLNLLNAIGMPFEYSASEITADKSLMQLLSNHINKAGHLSTMLNTNLVRCMSHAYYSATNIGHYGTGYEVYGHFTSPIRRLADSTTSRVIDDCYFETNPKTKRDNIKKWSSVVSDHANQASKMERVEEDVEKNVLYMETAIYLSDHIGEEFEATVISASNSGLCVQLDNLLEGKVRTRNLKGDYVYNDKTFTLLSISGEENYYVGDRLKVKLISADKDTKSVDFIVKEKIRENRIKDNNNTNQYIKKKAIIDQTNKTYIS